MMTYAELGKLLGITANGTRMHAKRSDWQIQLGNDGKARVLVPTETLANATAAIAAADELTEAREALARVTAERDRQAVEIARLTSLVVESKAAADELVRSLERERQALAMERASLAGRAEAMEQAHAALAASQGAAVSDALAPLDAKLDRLHRQQQRALRQRPRPGRR